MDAGPDAERVFELFGDPYVRTIVRAASREPMSVKDLSAECDSALSTVYRRVDDLVETGVLTERTAIEPDGSHHSVYETAIEAVTVRVADGTYELQLGHRRDPAERFATMWGDLRRA